MALFKTIMHSCIAIVLHGDRLLYALTAQFMLARQMPKLFTRSGMPYIYATTLYAELTDKITSYEWMSIANCLVCRFVRSALHPHTSSYASVSGGAIQNIFQMSCVKARSYNQSAYLLFIFVKTVHDSFSSGCSTSANGCAPRFEYAIICFTNCYSSATIHLH